MDFAICIVVFSWTVFCIYHNEEAKTYDYGNIEVYIRRKYVDSSSKRLVMFLLLIPCIIYNKIAERNP